MAANLHHLVACLVAENFHEVASGEFLEAIRFQHLRSTLKDVLYKSLTSTILELCELKAFEGLGYLTLGLAISNKTIVTL